jgi:hypothetical protein
LAEIFYLNDAEKVITAHFPVNMEGDEVYFTIYKKDNTIAVSRRKTGVIDHGKGTYSVDIGSLITTAGSYIVVFDIDGTNYAASGKINIKEYEIEQRDFQEFNAAKNPTRVVIKKTRTDSFTDAHKTVQLDFEYNSDNTPKKMEEKRL